MSNDFKCFLFINIGQFLHAGHLNILSLVSL